ncbi:glycosyltransferase [Corynebacterium casei]|uniref:glycosyltransferase n=1 Tax=Corynebacterium casei TaxID=160386 RepID=UPI003FD64C3F
MRNLAPGISVILPSYQGREFLPRVLKSLLSQTLDARLFELIVVLNGPDDGSEEFLDNFRRANSRMDVKVLTSAVSGASRARNIGLSSVSKEYLTFIDVDDEFEIRYLESGLGLVDGTTCALMPITDVKDGKKIPENSLNARIRALSGTTQLVRSISWCLGFNACKIVPTRLINKYRYSEDLRSGEDVAFFANLLRIPDLKISVPSDSSQSAYLRHERTESVSRQRESYDFSVVQRVECMSAIKDVEVHSSAEKARQGLMNAQFSFVESYLSRNPKQVDDAIELVISHRLNGFDFSKLRSERVKRLVISYCFPPYADTSANVAAKQIAKDGELVDVISANMGRVRTKDESTEFIAAKFVVRHVEIRGEPSFASWPLISSFATSALRHAVKYQKQNGPYESLYSRALWSGSHVAAALVKSKYPKIYWEAEFSDPLRKGVDGSNRDGKLTWGRTTLALKRVVSKSAWPDLSFDSHFGLTEAVTFILADRLVFTNRYQQQVMLEGYPASFKEMATAKSIVRSHALPSPDLVSIEKPKYDVDQSKINIGYFGNFYANRGIGPVIDAIECLPIQQRSRFALHVFCNKPNEVEELKITNAISTSVYARPYLPYLEFLSTLDQFDVLLVNDVDMEGSLFDVNPFLPSKYADYSASNAFVWGILSEKSSLGEMPLRFRSYQSKPNSIQSELFKMLEELG